MAAGAASDSGSRGRSRSRSRCAETAHDPPTTAPDSEAESTPSEREYARLVWLGGYGLTPGRLAGGQASSRRAAEMASLRADYTRRCLICEDSQAETTPEALVLQGLAEALDTAPQAASLHPALGAGLFNQQSAAYRLRVRWLREKLPGQVPEGRLSPDQLRSLTLQAMGNHWMSLAAACRPHTFCRVFRYEAGQLAPAPVTPRSQCLLDLLDQSSQPAPAPRELKPQPAPAPRQLGPQDSLETVSYSIDTGSLEELRQLKPQDDLQADSFSMMGSIQESESQASSGRTVITYTYSQASKTAVCGGRRPSV